MGKAAGESLCPNNGSLESMQVRCFHRGKTVKCTLILSSNFYLKKKKKKKRTFKTSVLYCILGGTSCPSVLQAATS